MQGLLRLTKKDYTTNPLDYFIINRFNEKRAFTQNDATLEFTRLLPLKDGNGRCYQEAVLPSLDWSEPAAPFSRRQSAGRRAYA